MAGPGLTEPLRMRFRDGGAFRVEGSIGGTHKSFEGSYKKGPLTLTLVAGRRDFPGHRRHDLQR
jgi:hypothetical protein